MPLLPLMPSRLQDAPRYLTMCVPQQNAARHGATVETGSAMKTSPTTLTKTIDTAVKCTTTYADHAHAYTHALQTSTLELPAPSTASDRLPLPCRSRFLSHRLPLPLPRRRTRSSARKQQCKNLSATHMPRTTDHNRSSNCFSVHSAPHCQNIR